MSPCRFLFTTINEFVEADAVNCDDFPAYAGDVAHGAAAGSADAFHDDFVVFVDEVEGAVAGQKRCD